MLRKLWFRRKQQSSRHKFHTYASEHTNCITDELQPVHRTRFMVACKNAWNDLVLVTLLLDIFGGFVQCVCRPPQHDNKFKPRWRFAFTAAVLHPTPVGGAFVLSLKRKQYRQKYSLNPVCIFK